MNRRIAFVLCISFAVATLFAQDPRERQYMYEILDPRHEAKPLVEGFATERVTERLNRGLYAVPSQDGKGVYLSWRLLNTDAPATAFHVYREANGKTRRLTNKPILHTCDFVMKNAGANIPCRDFVDERIVEEVRTGVSYYDK